MKREIWKEIVEDRWYLGSGKDYLSKGLPMPTCGPKKYYLIVRLDFSTYRAVWGFDEEPSTEEINEAIKDLDGPAADDFLSPFFVGVAEVAEILGWPKGKVSVYHKRGKLPPTCGELKSGPLWKREDIVKFKEQQYPAQPGERKGKMKIKEFTADKVLGKLLKYDGDNEWDEVISQYDIDENATAAADPSGMSDIAIFADGSKIIWDETSQEWKKG